MVTFIALLLIFGGIFWLAWWKVPAFRKFVSQFGKSSPNSSVISPEVIKKAKDRLVLEKERTAAVEEWVATQQAINAERQKQAAAKQKIQGGK